MSPASRGRLRRSGTVLPPPLPPPSGAVVTLRWIWYLVAVFVPFAGIFTALFLYDRDSWEERRVGRNCLLIGSLLWVLLPILLLMVLAALLIVGFLAMAADVAQPMD